MNDPKDLPRSTPSNEHIFSIDITGEATRKNFKGNFLYRVPNLKMKASAEKMRATLNSGLDDYLDLSVTKLHLMIAYLRFSLQETPEWWKKADWGYALDDYNVVNEVYEKVEKFQNEYKEAIWGKEEEKEGEPDTKKDSAPEKNSRESAA